MIKQHEEEMREHEAEHGGHDHDHHHRDVSKEDPYSYEFLHHIQKAFGFKDDQAHDILEEDLEHKSNNHLGIKKEMSKQSA